MSIDIRIGLISQEVQQYLPEIVKSSYGQIDNIHTKFNKNDQKINYDKVILQLHNLHIKEGDK